MVSSVTPPRSRKRPEERREEILSAAASIAVESGLERITLRAVAERLGVRPGLITHYFPAAEDLVVSAFARAATRERERFFPRSGTALERLAHFIGYIEGGGSLPLARLWLNARHLSRFSPALDLALREQDDLDRARLIEVITDGIADGSFAVTDAAGACTRVFLAIDGRGSYVNSTVPFSDEPAFAHYVADVAEWSLGLEPGALAQAISRQNTSMDPSG